MLLPQNMVRRRRRQGSLIGCAVLATMTLITTAIAVLPAPASARGSADRTEFVRHDDLNLTSQNDITKLHRRVSRAARHVCALPGIAAEILKRDINDCVDETRAEALENLEQRISFLAANARTAN